MQIGSQLSKSGRMDAIIATRERRIAHSLGKAIIFEDFLRCEDCYRKDNRIEQGTPFSRQESRFSAVRETIMTTDTTDRQLVWLALAIVAALVALPAFTMGFATMGTGSMMGGMGSGGMWGAGGSYGWMLDGAGMLIFLALVIGIASLSYRALTTQDGGTDTALEELRVAYARGDLSDEEYEQRRTRLETES